MFTFEVEIENGISSFSVGTVCPTNFDTVLKVLDSNGNLITSNDDHAGIPLLDNKVCSGTDKLSIIKDLSVSGGQKYTVSLSSFDYLKYGRYKILIVGPPTGIYFLILSRLT